MSARIDAIVTREVPGVAKAVKWNSPFYGVEKDSWCPFGRPADLPADQVPTRLRSPAPNGGGLADHVFLRRQDPAPPECG